MQKTRETQLHAELKNDYLEKYLSKSRVHIPEGFPARKEVTMRFEKIKEGRIMRAVAAEVLKKRYKEWSIPKLAEEAKEESKRKRVSRPLGEFYI